MLKKCITGISGMLLTTLLFVNGIYGAQKTQNSKKEIIIAGSTTVLPIAQLCAEAFMKKHPDVVISVRGGGSGVGIKALIENTVDIADASRKIKASEIKLARKKGINPYKTTIAKDGIAVIVNPENPISNISIDTLRDIFTGKITQWEKLTKDFKGRIIPVSRDVASGTYEVFEKYVLKGARPTPRALMASSNKQVATTVAQTKTSIGYVGFGYLNNRIKPLKINGIEPSVENIKSGKYPLSRSLYMYTNGKPEGIIKEFIDFILSEEGQKLVKKAGFIPVK